MSQQAIVITEQWLTQWVIGLNLCPFARQPYQSDKVRIVSTEAVDAGSVYQFILSELDNLYKIPADEVETTLVIIENYLHEFDEYLDFLGLLEKVIKDTGLEGVIQIASFHPDYVFAGEDQNDPANYTNRSPLPMFHLIREASLEKAIAHYPDPEKIPERNIALLREMGLEAIKKILNR